MIIGLAGYAGCGKDTIADLLPGFKKLSFAHALKLDVFPLLCQIGLDINDRSQKEIARPLLVAWGAVARKVNPNYWIDRLDDHMGINEQGCSRFVISDVRYPNEADWIKVKGGKVFYLSRPGVRPANDEELHSLDALKRECSPIHIWNDATPQIVAQRVINHL